MCTAPDYDYDMGGDFIRSLENDIKMFDNTVDLNKHMDKESVDYISYSNATRCHICEGEFIPGSDDYKVFDHDRFTGKYRGAAHKSCKSLFGMPKYIPVVVHNLSGYDAHLFLKSLHVTPGTIECIPNGEEKFISFSKSISVGTYIDKNGDERDIMREIRLIDSFRFMQFSLSSLVDNLPSQAFKNLEN